MLFQSGSAGFYYKAGQLLQSSAVQSNLPLGFPEKLKLCWNQKKEEITPLAKADLRDL